MPLKIYKDIKIAVTFDHIPNYYYNFSKELTEFDKIIPTENHKESLYVNTNGLHLIYSKKEYFKIFEISETCILMDRKMYTLFPRNDWKVENCICALDWLQQLKCSTKEKLIIRRIEFVTNYIKDCLFLKHTLPDNEILSQYISYVFKKEEEGN